MDVAANTPIKINYQILIRRVFFLFRKLQIFLEFWVIDNLNVEKLFIREDMFL